MPTFSINIQHTLEALSRAISFTDQRNLSSLEVNKRACVPLSPITHLCTGHSTLGLHSLLSVLFLFMTIIPKARPGVISGQKQCVLLKGVSKDGGCATTDSATAECNDEKKCCTKWWVLLPYPTLAPRAKYP
ncbi:beta-defensin 130B-like [Mustela lutreola]|uniref:beta-defensin 130B-like n=1 Tax=Mustela lutreola TaxID=9666 RepID=UPI00279784E2|nr:beta-defensin 130B-like [Mustela lutreola]